MKIILVFLMIILSVLETTSAKPAFPKQSLLKDVIQADIQDAIDGALNDISADSDAFTSDESDDQKVTKDSKGSEEATNDELESVNDAVSDDELKGDELQVVKGTKIESDLNIGVQYEVSFKVFPSEFKNGWHNILHFTKGGNSEQPGDRIPGVWFHTNDGDANERALYICSYVNGNKNYCIESQRVPVRKWTSVTIRQILHYGKYLYEVIVNEQLAHSIINSTPLAFHHVSLYVSDPWYAAQSGYIKDLYYGAPKDIKKTPENEQESILGSMKVSVDIPKLNFVKLMESFMKKAFEHVLQPSHNSKVASKD